MTTFRSQEAAALAAMSIGSYVVKVQEGALCPAVGVFQLTMMMMNNVINVLPAASLAIYIKRTLCHSGITYYENYIILLYFVVNYEERLFNYEYSKYFISSSEKCSKVLYQ